jgi:hypothetical protein
MKRRRGEKVRVEERNVCVCVCVCVVYREDGERTWMPKDWSQGPFLIW